MIVPIILAGGSGTRLWPLSRKQLPKQFIPLLYKHTLFQDVLERIADLPELLRSVVICNQQHLPIVQQQLQELSISDAEIIAEPFGKNTAPAIAIAALHLLQQGDDPIMLILPSDHVIMAKEKFELSMRRALTYANEGKLICFGVEPTKPETGYGYIKCGSAINNRIGCYEIANFVEKPNQQTAAHYVASGDYYWNSGMFMFRASAYLAELQHYAPEIFTICADIVNTNTMSDNVLQIDAEKFAKCADTSIDYAVMEHTRNAVVIRLESDWSDVGSWAALWEQQVRDCDGNVICGNVATVEVHDSYVHANTRKVVVLGVKDLVVIETADAVLVAHKDYSHRVKEFAAED